MKRKRETTAASGGFWSKLTSFFATKPDQDENNQPVDDGHKEPGNGYAGDNQVTDNSKRRRVTQSEERTPPRSQSKAPQTPIDHIREAVKQGLTREEFEKYAAILQGAVREDENYQPAEGNFPRRPIPVHPTSNASPTNIIRAFTGNTPTRHAVAPIGSYTPAQPDNQQLLRGLRSPLFDTSASFDGGRKTTKGLTVRSQERPVRRTPVRRRRVDSMQGIESISPSVATSITAKKILDTLNEFSSPLVDEVRRSAKKSSLAEKAKLQKRLARQLEDEDNTSEESVPTRSLTRQAVPTVPGKRKRSAAEDQSAPEGDLGTKAGKTSSASSFLLPSHPSTKGPRSAKKGASLTDHSALVGFDKEDGQANGKSGLPTLRAQTVGTGNGKMRVSEFRGAESDELDTGDDSFSVTKSHSRTFKSGPYQPNESEQLGEEEAGDEDQQLERGEEEHDEASLLPKKNKRARKAFAEDEGEEDMPSEVSKGATGAPFSSSIFGGFSAIKAPSSNKTSASVEKTEEVPFSLKGTSFTAFGSGSGVSSSGIGADLGSPIPSFSTSDGKSTEQPKDLSKKQKKEGGESSSSSIFSVSAESNDNLLSFMNPSIVASSASGSSSGPSVSSSSLFGGTFPFASDASGSKKKNLEEPSSKTDGQKPKEGASSDTAASSSSSASAGEGLSAFAFKTPSVKFGSSSSADSKEKTPESSKTLGGTGMESPDTKKDKGASSEGDTSSASSGFKPQSFGIPALGTGGFGTDGGSLSFLSGATKVASTALSGSPETKDAGLASLFPSSSASASLFSATAIDAGKKDTDTTPKKDSVSETAKSTQESTSSTSTSSSSLTASTSTLPIPGSSFSLFSASSSSALSSSSSPASTTSEDSKPSSSSSSSSSSSTSVAPSATDFLKLSGFQPVGESGDGATKGLLSLPAFGQPSFGTKSDAAKPTDKAAGAKEDKEKATEAKSESTAADAKKSDASSWATAPPFTIADWKSSAVVDFGAKTDSTKPTDQKDKSALASSSSSASSAFTPSLTMASDKPKAAASSFAYTFGSGASGSASGATALGGVGTIGGDSAMEADNAAGGAAAAASHGAFSFGGQTPSGSFGFGGGAGGADLSLSTPFGASSASAGGMPSFTPSTVITPPSVSTPSGGMFVFGASSDSGPSSSSSSSSMFGGGPSSASSGPSPFAASSPFGASPAVSNPSPFGAQPTSVFGSTPAAATPLSVFGSTPSADPFGGGGGFGSNPTPNTFASPASVFGGGPTASSSGGFGGFGTQPQQQPSMGGGGMAVFGSSDPSPFSGSFSSQPSPSQFGGFGGQPQQQASMGGGGGGGFSLGVAAPQDKNRRIVRAARRGRGK